MRKHACFLSFFLLFATYIFSQDTVYLKKATGARTVTDRPPQAVFAEIFGRSIFFSLNYDRRFAKKLDGLGFSVGAGYILTNNIGLFSLPVTLNYLLGNNGKYLEVGAGASYFNRRISNFDGLVNNNGSSLIGTMTIGYRSQPIKGGFMFRVGINPFFLKNNFIPYYPYVSFGYTF